MRRRWSRGRWLTGLTAAVAAGFVGFLLVVQFSGEVSLTRRLETETEANLTRILASQTEEADALQQEIADLRLQLATLRSSRQRDEATIQSAKEQLAALEVLAGTTAVEGPGVTVTVHDPERKLTYDRLIDLVQELRDAGAEAMGVNEIRVGAMTAFGERDERLVLDGAELDAPYSVSAIGDPATLQGGLEIPGGALDALTAAGLEARVKRVERLRLPALRRLPTFEEGSPVTSSP